MASAIAEREYITAEAPGAVFDCYVCPNCSKYYPARRIDETGGVTDEHIDAPANCRRCGSPMHVNGDAWQEFSDANAYPPISAPDPNRKRVFTDTVTASDLKRKLEEDKEVARQAARSRR